MSFFTKHFRLLSCQHPLTNNISNAIVLGRGTWSHGMHNSLKVCKVSNKTPHIDHLFWRGLWDSLSPLALVLWTWESVRYSDFVKLRTIGIAHSTSQSPCRCKQVQEAGSKKPPEILTLAHTETTKSTHSLGTTALHTLPCQGFCSSLQHIFLQTIFQCTIYMCNT